MRRPALIAFALVSGCFALGVTVEPDLAVQPAYARHERSPVEVILGEARRFFAGHFFIKADVYFHSGYYPSIFDQGARGHDNHIATGAGAVEGQEHEEADFLGKPLDIIDRFSRSFFPSSHTHLDAEEHDHAAHREQAGEHTDEPHAGQEQAASKVREMLPWLRMTAELDPNRIETYTVGAYWLRTRMNKPREAEAFLRDGLRANPGSYAILFELGRIYRENYRDFERARNLWEAALKHWNRAESGKSEPDNFLLLQITWQLALLEQEVHNFPKAISYLELAKPASPKPAEVQNRIDELRALSR